MSDHANISIFVPHIGCPNMCTFCNQCHITGSVDTPTADDVSAAVETAKKSKTYNPFNTEIAFFGGSFTAIEREYMIYLLESGYKYVKDGTVRGIRISTRPDAINEEVLEILKKYGVTSIELGAQSLCDDVLTKNKRGHSAKDVYNASNLIKSYGFSLGLQMMTGLYGSSDDKDIYTAEQIISLLPDTVRIYPTVVLKDTELADLMQSGKYVPQTLESAVKLCSKLYLMFEENNIRVIRLGLHTIEKDAYLGGAFHPAFSELCLSEIFLDRAINILEEKGKYILYVNKCDLSKMIGQKRSNIEILKNMGYDCTVRVCESISKNGIKIIKAGE